MDKDDVARRKLELTDYFYELGMMEEHDMIEDWLDFIRASDLVKLRNWKGKVPA